MENETFRERFIQTSKVVEPIHINQQWTDLGAGVKLSANDPRTLASKAQRIAAAQAEQAAFEAMR